MNPACVRQRQRECRLPSATTTHYNITYIALTSLTPLNLRPVRVFYVRTLSAIYQATRPILDPRRVFDGLNHAISKRNIAKFYLKVTDGTIDEVK